MRRAAAALLCAALLGTAPADPLLARLLAGTAAAPPAALNFERVAAMSQTSDGKTERHVRVDRWDGRAWQVLSLDGQPPAPKAAAEAIKAATAAGVPGYYRLAPFLGGGAVRAVDADGRVSYRLNRLPPGSLAVKGAPPDKFSAELSIDTAGPVPFVRRARYYAPAPMRMMMVAKLDRFEAVSEFRIGSGGRPELARQTVDLAGALFGRSGSQHQDTSYSYR